MFKNTWIQSFALVSKNADFSDRSELIGNLTEDREENLSVNLL